MSAVQQITDSNKDRRQGSRQYLDVSIHCLYMEDSFFEWDDAKAEENVKDHGVTFIEARSIFQDPGCVEIYDEAHAEGEGRYVDIGFSSRARLLFVVFTTRGERIRIISARIAEPDEETIYEQNN